MSKRRAITERMKVDALLWRFTINCRLCLKLLAPADAIEWDHVQPIAMGGEHHHCNIAPVHRACHAKKTFRPRGGATTIGGDNYEAKKTARMERKVAGTWQVGKPKRKLPKGRKLQSRGFEKRRSA